MLAPHPTATQQPPVAASSSVTAAAVVLPADVTASDGGRFDFEDGGSYCGGWSDGKAHGYGICTGPGGHGVYAGAWTHGFETSGTYTWPNGHVYAGQWSDGRRQGLGVETHGRWLYRGEWTSGVKGRYGVRHSTVSGARYEGTWAGGLQDGYGVETYADQSTYQGQWVRGQRHGFGVRQSAAFNAASPTRQSDDAVTRNNLQQEHLHNSLPVLNSVGVDGSGGATLQIRGRSTERGRAGFAVTGKGKVAAGVQEEQQKRSRSASLRRTIADGFGRLGRKKKAHEVSADDIRTLQNSTNKNPVAPTSESNSINANSAPSGEIIETYMGEWRADKRSGFGVSQRSDGLRYSGEWFNDKKCGYGATYYPDGRKDEQGKYKDNVLISDAHSGSRKLFVIRVSNVRSRVTAAVTQARKAAETAAIKADVAVSRRSTAKSKAEQSEIAAQTAADNAQIARTVGERYEMSSGTRPPGVANTMSWPATVPPSGLPAAPLTADANFANCNNTSSLTSRLSPLTRAVVDKLSTSLDHALISPNSHRTNTLPPGRGASTAPSGSDRVAGTAPCGSDRGVSTAPSGSDRVAGTAPSGSDRGASTAPSAPDLRTTSAHSKTDGGRTDRPTASNNSRLQSPAVDAERRRNNPSGRNVDETSADNETVARRKANNPRPGTDASTATASKTGNSPMSAAAAAANDDRIKSSRNGTAIRSGSGGGRNDSDGMDGRRVRIDVDGLDQQSPNCRRTTSVSRHHVTHFIDDDLVDAGDVDEVRVGTRQRRPTDSTARTSTATSGPDPEPLPSATRSPELVVRQNAAGYLVGTSRPLVDDDPGPQTVTVARTSGLGPVPLTRQLTMPNLASPGSHRGESRPNSVDARARQQVLQQPPVNSDNGARRRPVPVNVDSSAPSADRMSRLAFARDSFARSSMSIGRRPVDRTNSLQCVDVAAAREQPPAFRREDVSVLSQRRRDELRRQREEAEKETVVLSLDDVKDWCRRHQLAMFFLTLNLTLAAIFYNVISPGS